MTEQTEDKWPFRCQGYAIDTPDMLEHECRHKHAGKVNCDMCVLCGGDYDPRTGKRYVERRRGKR